LRKNLYLPSPWLAAGDLRPIAGVALDDNHAGPAFTRIAHPSLGGSNMTRVPSRSLPLLTDVAGAKRPIARSSAIILLFTLLAALPSIGATLTVTSLADDGTPGTLRTAIANAASGDTINFGVTGTITLTSTLSIGKNLSISGPGASNLAISGNNAVQVLSINGASVTISAVTIKNGYSDIPGIGGGIYISFGSLTLRDAVVTGNAVSYSGGGIENYQGTVNITNSMISGNSASGYGGGGIFNYGGTVTVTNSTVSGNSSTGGRGGGIFNYAYPSGATLTLTNSTVAANSAPAGAGIYNFSFFYGAGGNMSLTNSTFSGNTASSIGGAIFSHTAGSGTVTLTNGTLSGNTSPHGGGFYSGAGLFLVKSTLLATTSSGGNCETGSGQTISYGHNLSDDASCANILNQAGDLNSTPAGLDPSGLQSNGGPTQTIALLSTSRAVDAIPVSACTDIAGSPITTDQRGIARPQGSGCDIGAFEYSSTQALVNSLTATIASLNLSPQVAALLMGYVQQVPTGIANLTAAQKAAGTLAMNNLIAAVNGLVSIGFIPPAAGSQLVNLATAVIAALR
jgi:hypothetical protein